MGETRLYMLWRLDSRAERETTNRSDVESISVQDAEEPMVNGDQQWECVRCPPRVPWRHGDQAVMFSTDYRMNDIQGLAARCWIENAASR